MMRLVMALWLALAGLGPIMVVTALPLRSRICFTFVDASPVWSPGLRPWAGFIQYTVN